MEFKRSDRSRDSSHKYNLAELEEFKMELPRLWRFGERRPVFALALLGVVVLLAAWRLTESAKARKYKLPPRIPGIPIFGNTFQLPPLKQGVWGIEMAKKYGEM